MKRFLLWLVGVAVGVAVMLAAVVGVSYSFTGEGSRPAAQMQFGGVELEANGSSWQVPLVGGIIDKVFVASNTLTVQKLGTFYDAHPALTLPDWATYAELYITDSAGNVVFSGSASDYEAYAYAANGDYKAELTVWRLAEGMTVVQYEGGANGSLHKNAGLEHPAKPVGYYHYAFRFTLQASASVELSAERVEQGGVVGVLVTGLTGESAPTAETDLGAVQFVRSATGWRAYISAAYNAEAGAHDIVITVNGEAQTRTLTVTPRDFGTVELEADEEAAAGASEEFRNAIWPLYEQAAREKLWSGGWLCPAENYMTLVDYGQTKVIDGVQGARSNSTKLYTIPGEAARAPAAGVVVLARTLSLTGNTVVIDHGCGMRSYLYGLAAISVSEGQTVERGQAVGALGEDLTMDFKLGSKSVNPWPLFQSSGGLFWREDE